MATDEEVAEAKRQNEEFWARQKAELEQDIAVGKRCMTCHTYLYPMKVPGYPTSCYECRDLLIGSKEVDHHKYVRCPKCRSQFEPDDQIDSDAMVAAIWCGESIKIWCWRCDHTFEVGTHCSVSYTSPPVETEEIVEDEDDDTE